MARQKKPEGETLEEAEIRRTKETIANKATRNEKVAWDRRMDNMVTLLARLAPIEDQLTDLMAQKLPILDEIQLLRSNMVRECVHPFTHLVYHEDHVVCKFCNKKFNVVE